MRAWVDGRWWMDGFSEIPIIHARWQVKDLINHKDHTDKQNITFLICDYFVFLFLWFSRKWRSRIWYVVGANIGTGVGCPTEKSKCAPMCSWFMHQNPPSWEKRDQCLFATSCRFSILFLSSLFATMVRWKEGRNLHIFIDPSTWMDPFPAWPHFPWDPQSRKDWYKAIGSLNLSWMHSK